jgi:hypothetical protein
VSIGYRAFIHDVASTCGRAKAVMKFSASFTAAVKVVTGALNQHL